METEEMSQVRAEVPSRLKRQAFAIMALRDLRFNKWLTEELETFVRESRELAAGRRDPKELDEEVVLVTQ